MEDQLVKALEDSVNDFVNGLQADEKRIFDSVLNLIKQLEIKNGSIKRNVTNLRLIKDVKTEVDKILFTNRYYKKVSDFTDMYEEIANIQNAYYSSIVDNFSVSQTVKEIQKQAVIWTKNDLTKGGLPNEISQGISNIITTNIKDGGSYSDLAEQLRHTMLSTKESQGLLIRNAETYAIDAVNTYTAMYSQQMTSDLGIEWFKYVGSLIKTSRPWCRKLIEAKKNGMSFIHKSQFEDLLKGKINGGTVALNPKTHLPYGMKDGTNVSNLQTRRGGWRCGHQLIGVSRAIVPPALRKKFEK